MQTDLRGRDLISLQEWTREEIETILDVATDLKRQRALGQPHPYLRDKVLAMLFFYSSTRTRASFEAGMAQLGGHAQFIESRTTQIAHGDTAREIGEILGRYNDGIAIRNVDWGLGNTYIREVAAASRVPVLNMQCDLFHPHQSLADLLTIRALFIASLGAAGYFLRPLGLNGPMAAGLGVLLGLGIVVSMVLGGGLMALVFYSNRKGYDR